MFPWGEFHKHTACPSTRRSCPERRNQGGRRSELWPGASPHLSTGVSSMWVIFNQADINQSVWSKWHSDHCAGRRLDSVMLPSLEGMGVEFRSWTFSFINSVQAKKRIRQRQCFQNHWVLPYWLLCEVFWTITLRDNLVINWVKKQLVQECCGWNLRGVIYASFFLSWDIIVQLLAFLYPVETEFIKRSKNFNVQRHLL